MSYCQENRGTGAGPRGDSGHKPLILVSSCLVGLCSRYDSRLKPCPACLEQLQGRTWLPICPEQLGGLSTPRVAADLVGGDGHDVLGGRARVITKTGVDVTANFILGAEQCLVIARAQNIGAAFLRAKSPSCALTGTIGVTAALLLDHGLELKEF